MAKTKIKIKGTKQLESKLAALVAMTGDATEALKNSAVAIQEGAQANIRSKLNKNPTGKLESEVSVRPIDKNMVEIGVFDDVYGRVHEFGAIIKPVTAKMLRFEVNGEAVFAKQVQIPQRSWLRPAVESERKRVTKLLTQEMESKIKEIAK